ncbi:MAG: hypothetical protein M1319_07115 [Chloroflexi bacterium]|nr:hypothetical protein [Chloroflexota bacterium]
MIRGLELRDSAGVRGLRNEEIDLSGLPPTGSTFSPLVAALASTTPTPWQKWHTYVYEEGGRIVALAQSRVRYRRDEWEVVYLSSVYPAHSGHKPSNAEMWCDLLEHMGRYAGLAGARRLYAKLPDGVSDPDLFYNAGFHCYTKEHLFAIDRQAIVSGPMQLAVRPQTGSDVWAIHQLYNASTPSMVRQVEPLSSDRWHLPMHLPFTVPTEAGYVCEDHQGLAAYFRVEGGGGVRVIRPIFRPERRSGVPAALGMVLATLKPSRRDPVFCSLWEHQLEFGSALEDMGFSRSGGQLLLVKHTIEVVRIMQKQAVPAVKATRTMPNPSGLSRGASLSR